MYEMIEDIRARLENTIIRYDNEPVLVTGHDGFNIFIKYLSGAKKEMVSIKDKKLNFKSIPLGYVNYKGRAYYLQRIPNRRWKHGVSTGGIYSATPNAPIEYLLEKPLVATVKNIYCSYDKALKEIEKKTVSAVAFDRSLSIRKEELGNTKLEYKGTDAGYFEADKVLLGKNFKHLKEQLIYKGVKIYER